MIYAFWGTLAGVTVLFLYAAHQAIPTFGREPTGVHHKPAEGRFEEARNWVAFKAGREVRMITGRDRRKARERERDRDAAWLREAQEIHAEQHMDTMPRGPVPEWPLPPEVEHVREPYGHDAPGMPDDAYFCASDGEEWPCAAVAEDPHDVASDEQHADAYVGPVTGHTGATPETCPECPPGPELFDRSADHWGEDTLLGMPAVTDA